MKRFAILAAAVALTALAFPATRSFAAAAPPGQAAPAAGVFNVRSYGAVGDGSTNDTSAVNAAITAANGAGGGTVEFPSGTYKSKNTIHMKSNVTLRLDAGSTLLGSSADTYDAAESNPNDEFQDYGHSHFHDAMIYGDNLTNIGFVGSGTIDGGGFLITGNPGSGEADKIISLTRCNGLTLSGITLRRGGHFAALINDCTNVVSDHLTIDTASDRDGWNIISTTNVTITNINIASNDDALVFKSDWALGATLPNGHVTVTHAQLSAKCCNALMFGSETCGDFTDYQFSDIHITGAGKSGLGIVSMDGANISDVHYHDVTMTGVHSPIMEKIGTRKRCGGSPRVGHIGNITYDNVTGTGVANTAYSPTLWGESGGNHIQGVAFHHVNLTVPGGNGTTSTGVPSNNATDYNPNSIGTRPAFGLYIHNADNIHFTDSSVRFGSNDNRPAIIVNTGSAITFDGLTAQRGSGSPADLVFQSVSGYCVSNSANTGGGALRITSTSSTVSCPSRYEAEYAELSLGDAINNDHAGFTGTGFVNTANAAGAFVRWTLDATADGTRTVTIAYANGTTEARPLDVDVNGTAVSTGVSFPPTGSWSTWATATMFAPLHAGENTLTITAATDAGAPNLDHLDVS